MASIEFSISLKDVKEITFVNSADGHLGPFSVFTLAHQFINPFPKFVGYGQIFRRNAADAATQRY